jgi:hypothetical protein
MRDGVKSPDSRRRISSLIRRHAMKGNGAEGKIPQKGKNPNTFKARVSNPKETSSRKGLPSKGASPRGMLMGSPKGHVSITMKWGITTKIAPNLNQGMGVLR